MTEKEKWRISIIQFIFCILFVIMLILSTATGLISNSMKIILIVSSGVLGLLSLFGIVPATFKFHH